MAKGQQKSELEIAREQKKIEQQNACDEETYILSETFLMSNTRKTSTNIVIMVKNTTNKNCMDLNQLEYELIIH